MSAYPEPTVSAVILDPENRILLCRSVKWAGKYVIPGGHIEIGESMEDALRREIMEETGLEVFDIRPLGLQECIFAGDYHRQKHFIFIDYLCRSRETEVVLNDEADAYVWVPPDELNDYILGGYTKNLLSELLSGDASTSRRKIYYNYVR